MKKEKLLTRFLNKPKDFTYSELKRLLSGFGYEENSKGKTSGSRVAFINEKTKHIISIHKPHPGNIIKLYILDIVKDALIEKGLI